MVRALTMSSLAAGACVVPPPIDVEDQDAGVNAPPVIISAADDTGVNLLPPATLTLNRLDPGELDLTVYDVDTQDELTLQFFIDYNRADPSGPRVTCTVPPPATPSPTRTVTCNASICPTQDGSHRLEIEVYDRRPLPEPPYRKMPEGQNGLFSTWTLDLVCTSPI